MGDGESSDAKGTFLSDAVNQVHNDCHVFGSEVPVGFRPSNFGFVSDFGFWILDFGPKAGWTAAVLASLLLVGCAVGPNYHRPAAFSTNAMPSAFGDTTSTNLGEWKTAQPSAHLPRGAWWEIYGEAELNRLETLATAGNQQLAAALANYEQARALLKAARADFYPQVSTSPSVTRQRTSANQFQRAGGSGGGTTFNTFSVPLDASWELDLWGRVRRQVEGSQARLAAAADDLETAKLAIQAQVATAYFTLCSLEAQDRLLRRTIVAYQRALDLTQDRRKFGVASELDVAQADTQLKSTAAQLPVVELQRANLRHALATLCGQPATTFKLTATNTALTAGPTVPVSLPSELLEQRPDIAAAERRMAAANADVGVAQGAFYPRVLLNGMAGFQSVDASTLFNWPSHVWAVGPSLQWPLFTGGRTRAQLTSARAGYEAAVANYRQTVLAAFQDVEDQLAAVRLLEKEFEAENAALQAAQRTLEISNDRYKNGITSYLEVTIAQSLALNREQTVVGLGAARMAASVSLVKALGAGWPALREPPPPSAPLPAGPAQKVQP
jgi:outer membrane protein, multidrug efflux system